MLEIVAGIAIVGYVIGRQLLGEPLRGKRLIVLPAVLTVIGLVDLAGDKDHHDLALSVALIAASALVAAVIGTAQGLMMRLSNRDGFLHGQMPVQTLWLWAALIASRLAIIAVAKLAGADLAAASASILFTLGINRLAQAGVIGARAYLARIPFAPEKDGRVFMGQLFEA